MQVSGFRRGSGGATAVGWTAHAHAPATDRDRDLRTSAQETPRVIPLSSDSTNLAPAGALGVSARSDAVAASGIVLSSRKNTQVKDEQVRGQVAET